MFLVILVVLLGYYLLVKPKTIEINPLPVGAKSVEITPELIGACACESSYEGKSSGVPQHYEQDGVTVRWGRVNKYDRGICQINVKIHGEELKRLGLDVEKRADNIEYANRLYKLYGLKPWAWSYNPETRKCNWEK